MKASWHSWGMAPCRVSREGGSVGVSFLLAMDKFPRVTRAGLGRSSEHVTLAEAGCCWTVTGALIHHVNSLSKNHTKLGPVGDRVCTRALERESGEPHSCPDFAPLNRLGVQVFTPAPSADPRPLLSFGASPTTNTRPAWPPGFCTCVPSLWSLPPPHLLGSEQVPILSRHPHLPGQTTQTFPRVSTPWVREAAVTLGAR